MNYHTASNEISNVIPVLDRACPVLDTGESSPVLWIPASAGMTTRTASIEE
jgi:hypothetical protein